MSAAIVKELNPEQRKALRDAEAIEKMLASKGWQLIKEAIEADLVTAAYGLGADPAMPEQELHYRRGRLSATRDFLNAPAMLAQNFYNKAPVTPDFGDEAIGKAK